MVLLTDHIVFCTGNRRRMFFNVVIVALAVSRDMLSSHICKREITKLNQ